MNAVELGNGYAQAIIKRIKQDPPEKLLTDDGKDWLNKLCTDGLSQDIYYNLCEYLSTVYPNDHVKQEQMFAELECDMDFQQACNDELLMEYDWIIEAAEKFHA